MNRRRAHVVAAALTSIVFGISLAPAAPALAATKPEIDTGVALSRDGTTWTSDLTAPLFDQDTGWVPGDRQQASFFVRNDGESDADLTITIDAEERDGLIAADVVTLTATTSARGRAVPIAGNPTRLGRLAEGAAERIDLAALVHGSATNETMRRIMRFTVVVELAGTPTSGTDAERDTRSAEAPSHPIGLLAYTGTDRPWGVLAAGLAMLTIGLSALISLLALRRRTHPRRRSTHRRGVRS